MKNIIEEIRGQLKQNADPKNKESAKNFFKEDIKLYGVKTDAVRKIAKEYFKTVKASGKAGIFALCVDWFCALLQTK